MELTRRKAHRGRRRRCCGRGGGRPRRRRGVAGDIVGLEPVRASSGRRRGRARRRRAAAAQEEAEIRCCVVFVAAAARHDALRRPHCAGIGRRLVDPCPPRRGLRAIRTTGGHSALWARSGPANGAFYKPSRASEPSSWVDLKNSGHDVVNLKATRLGKSCANSCKAPPTGTSRPLLQPALFPALSQGTRIDCFYQKRINKKSFPPHTGTQCPTLVFSTKLAES